MVGRVRSIVSVKELFTRIGLAEFIVSLGWEFSWTAGEGLELEGTVSTAAFKASRLNRLLGKSIPLTTDLLLLIKFKEPTGRLVSRLISVDMIPEMRWEDQCWFAISQSE